MKVLVADDDNATRSILEHALAEWGYDTVAAENGEEAWNLLSGTVEAPRMALLDWVMPGIDGLEVCRKLKQREDAAPVYTILLTAKTEKADLVAGLEAGADDFITKPFERDELRSRLAAGARIVQYESALDGQNELLEEYAGKMESLAEQRARQLVHSDRMATLGIMAAGIAHEINNPATFISGNIALLERFWQELEPMVCREMESGEADPEKLRFMHEQMPSVFRDMREGVARISKIVKGMKAYARKSDEERSTFDVNECIANALMLCHNALKKHIRVEQCLADDLPLFAGRQQEIEQVLINLITNAADAMNSLAEERGQDGVLKVSTQGGDAIQITIEDNGGGIPQDQMDTIWVPFYTTKETGKGTGLGLSISQSIVQEHGGGIYAENTGKGARFIVRLPAQDTLPTDRDTGTRAGTELRGEPA